MTSSHDESFAVALRRHRQARGLSQQELADLAGLSVRGLSALERGERLSPQPATVRRIASALNLDGPARKDLIALARQDPSPPDDTQNGLAVDAPDEAGSRWAPLPVPLTSIIGRSQDLAGIRDRLAPQAPASARLLTLTGPGGIGKTRLALAAGHDLAPLFQGRVAWVDLAGIRDESFVLASIAGAIGIPVNPGIDLTDALAELLADQPSLLILDNFEHVLGAAPVVSTILTRCEYLRVIATSRERLNLRGERIQPVAPLSGPESWDPDGPESVAAVAASASAQLFVDRAGDLQPDFQLTSANASVIAQICRRLEGMPLALELAAGQIQTLAPAVILDRLTHQLSVLVEGPRDLGARQQSMYDTIAWSYALLTPGQAAVFSRLGVFAGGFTIAAAEAVCEATANQPDAHQTIDEDALPDDTVADIIAALVRKSLVERESRFARADHLRLLEVIREFAADQLVKSGEAPAAQRAHARYFLDYAEGFSRISVAAQDIVPALDQVEAALPNIRAAFAWFERARDTESLLRLAGSLNWLWPLQQHIHEGVQCLNQALSMPGPASPPVRVRAMMALGFLVYLLGDDQRTEQMYTDALSLATSANDQIGAALAVTSLGALAVHQGDHARGAALSEQALALCAAIPEPHTATWLTASALSNLGWARHRLGSSAAARHHLEVAVEHFRDLEYKMGLMRTLQYAAGVARDELDYAAAIREFGESLDLAAELGDNHRLAAAFDGLATTAVMMGESHQAARYFGVSARLREQLGGHQAAPPLDRISHRHGVDATRAHLGEAEFRRAIDAGRKLSRADAIAEARDVTVWATSNPDSTARDTPDRPQSNWNPT